MDRRDFVLTAGLSLAATAALAGDSAAAAATVEHHHGAAPAAGNDLAHAASHCVQAADACVAHCLQMLGDGQASLAACATSATAVRAVCDTLAQLATRPAPLLARYAAVAQAYCDDCAAECRPHADKHATCKACLEACEACSKECAKLAA